MPGCHYQSRTERENDMDKTYEPIGNKPGEKIKVDSIDTIVTTHGDKPYYENKYREVGDKCYHIGYSSYRLDVALEYREKYFELVERENDWIPVSERLPKKPEIDGDSDDYIVQTRRVAQPFIGYKNKEGYCDPTAGKAIQDASRIPHHVKEAHKALKDIASLLGFEVLVLRDGKTGRIYRWKQ